MGQGVAYGRKAVAQRARERLDVQLGGRRQGSLVGPLVVLIKLADVAQVHGRNSKVALRPAGLSRVRCKPMNKSKKNNWSRINYYFRNRLAGGFWTVSGPSLKYDHGHLPQVLLGAS